MTVLFANTFLSLTSDAIQKALRNMGAKCVEKTYYTPDDLYEDRKLDGMLAKDIKLIKPDLVFSVNFWPPIARVCHKAHIKYISYGYDSPQNLPDTRDMDYETNFIFTFDYDEYQGYVKQGIDRVYHMPLATDVGHWDSIKAATGTYDISFIGNIYESTFPMLLSGMDDYLRGYFKAIATAQQKVYGYFFLDELIDEDKLSRVNECFKKKDKKASVSKKQLSYSAGTYVTHLDRVILLNYLKTVGKMHFFTQGLKEDKRKLLDGVNIYGGVSYEEEMPAVFKASKINLNPVFRVIRTGIPQRALDIMGCNAFLLSSYQVELGEYFIPDEEVVMYDSYEDAVAKARFYLAHDDIRNRIALNGYNKVKEHFTYEKKLGQMLEIAEIFI